MKRGFWVLCFLLAPLLVHAQTVELLGGSQGECGWNGNVCWTAYNITAGGDSFVLDENSYWFEFRDSKNLESRHARNVKGLFEHDVRIAEPVYKTYNFWVAKPNCEVLDDNGGCLDEGGYEERTKVSYIPTKQQTKVLRAGESAVLYVSGRKKPFERVDNVLVLKQPGSPRANLDGYVKYEEWYWWGSFPFYNSTDPSNANLTAYYSFDNMTGGASAFAWNDLNDTTYNLDARTGAPAKNTSGKIANQTYFDGNDDLNTGTDVLDTSNVSVVAWVTSSQPGTVQVITDWGGASGEFAMLAHITPNKFRCSARIGGSDRNADFPLSIIPGEKYFIGCAVSENATSDAVTIFVANNTAVMGTGSIIGNFGLVTDQNQRLAVGQRSNGAGLFFNGGVDELGIWKDRVLSNLEFEALWNNTAGCNPTKYPTCNITSPIGPNVNTSTFHTSETIETNQTTFTLLLDHTLQNASVGTANLTYNGTIHAPIVTNTSGPNSTNFTFQVNITTPSPGQPEENITFFWTYFTNSSGGTTNFANTSNQQQTIYQVYLDDCVQGWPSVITRNYTVRDIDDNSLVTLDTVTSTWDVSWNSKTRTYTPTWSGGSEFTACIYPRFATYNSTFNLSLEANGYVDSDFSLIQSLSQPQQNITLFMANTSGVSAVTINVKSSTDVAQENVLISIEQFDAPNNFTLFASGFTDFQGNKQFLLNTSREYRINLSRNGQLLTLVSGDLASVGPFQILTTELNFRVLIGAGGSLKPFINLLQGDYNIAFDNTTGTFTYTYDDTQGFGNQFCLEVIHYNASETTNMGENCSTIIPTGNVTIDVGNLTGIFQAFGDGRSSEDGRTYILTSLQVVRLAASEFGTSGILLALFIILTTSMVGLVSTGGKAAGLISGSVFGLGLSSILSLISLGWGTLIGVVVGAGIILWKMQS